MAKSSRKKPVRKASGASARKSRPAAKSSKKKTSVKKAAAAKKTVGRAAAGKDSAGTKKKKTSPSQGRGSKRSSDKAASATKQSVEKPTTPAAKSTETASATGDKKGPKGITVVTSKPSRKESSRVKMPETEPLLKPGGKWKPLIPSGPSAAPAEGANGDDGARGKKQRLTKRELDKYRKILLAKREELLGDITNMEDEALRGSGSGSLSHTPQHMAEQGSDAYDQALSLDLAQVDRNLLKQIDDALKRIDEGTYGFCELTGKRIRNERLEELPWTRFSIEAARERERRSYR